MTLTTEQVLTLAPDPTSAAAGRKLAHPRAWRNLGRSEEALWGECQGTALYQVCVDLPGRFRSPETSPARASASLGPRQARAGPVTKCSCPSRKLPCKHALGLMLMAAANLETLPVSEPPPWVAEWLQNRARAAEQREPKSRPTAPPDAAAQAKRAGQRLERVREGIEALDLWMHDLVRNGLATVDAMGSAPWEAQAARLVDAQASGLASRLRGLSGIPRATSDWAEELLAALGRISLLTQAFRRIDDLDGALRADVRQLVGWTLKEEEVVAAGDLVQDDWVVLGQWTEDDERFRIQRTWLKAVRSGRFAMVLQFAAGTMSFADTFIPATHFEAVLAFWPSAFPLRAFVHEWKAGAVPWEQRLPGCESIAAFLLEAAHALACQPWISRLPCIIRDVMPVPLQEETWSLVDRDRATLPLVGADTWPLLAISGGRPIDVVAEWDGRVVRPLFASAWGEQTTWARPVR